MYHRAPRIRSIQTALAAVLVVLVVAACSTEKTNGPRIATSLTTNTGTNGQSGVASALLAQTISVNVTDQNMIALQGAVVTWTTVAGSGTVDSVTSMTNSNGDASTDWTLGATVGAQVLHASLAGGASVTINATATAIVPTAVINKARKVMP